MRAVGGGSPGTLTRPEDAWSLRAASVASPFGARLEHEPGGSTVKQAGSYTLQGSERALGGRRPRPTERPGAASDPPGVLREATARHGEPAPSAQREHTGGALRVTHPSKDAAARSRRPCSCRRRDRAGCAGYHGVRAEGCSSGCPFGPCAAERRRGRRAWGLPAACSLCPSCRRREPEARRAGRSLPWSPRSPGRGDRTLSTPGRSLLRSRWAPLHQGVDPEAVGGEVLRVAAELERPLPGGMPPDGEPGVAVRHHRDHVVGQCPSR